MAPTLDDQGYTIVKHFHKKKKQWWLIGYIFNTSKVELKVTAGDGIVNLRSKTKWDLVDFIVTGLTGGLVNSVTIEVEGMW